MGATDDVVTGVEGVSASWLGRVLADETDGADVTDLEVEPIGTGQVADTVRLRPTWDPPGAGPTTLVAKVPSSQEASRAAALATRTYEVEAGFYRDLAADLPVRAPRCHHAAHDPATDAYAVVLEDVAPAVQGDQIAGCSVDEAVAAIDELALLHAPRWGDPSLGELAWLDRRDAPAQSALAGLVGLLAPGFVERFAPSLDDDVVAVVEAFPTQAERYLLGRSGPLTVAHNDYRVDNLLFGGERVVVVDWQTVTRGPGVDDLSYFLGASLPTEVRRAHERDLVEHYRQRMAEGGVDLEVDQLWRDYRWGAFAGVLMTIVASMLVAATDRGDAMFTAMAERHARHVIDLEGAALVG